MSTCQAAIYNFLRQNSTTDNDSALYTVISHFAPKDITFPIRQGSLSNFWSMYCKEALQLDGNVPIGFSEYKPINPPFIVQCRLVFDNHNSGTTDIPDEFYTEFVRSCQNVMRSHLEITDDTIYNAAVLTADNYIKSNDKYSFDFRVQFPFCRVVSATQENVLIPALIRELRRNVVLHKIKPSPIGDWSNIIDVNIPGSYVPLYGSTIIATEPKILYRHLWGIIDTDEEYTEELDICDFFNSKNGIPDGHTQITSGLVDTSIFDDVEYDSEYWLPMFFSCYYTMKITTEKISNDKTVVNPNQIARPISPAIFRSEDESEIFDPIVVVESLLPFVNDDKANQRGYWLDIGRALYSAYKGEDEGCNRWVEFTERGDTFTSQDCIDLYGSFSDTTITAKTIAFYASKDNPNHYKEWHKSWSNEFLANATSCYDVDIAAALWSLYWLDYVWVPGTGSNSRGTWYKFEGHIYRVVADAIELSRSISGRLVEEFEDYRARCNAMSASTRENPAESTNRRDFVHQMQANETKKIYEERAKLITKLIGKLKSDGSKRKIISSVRERFYDREFESRLDTNPLLTGTKNCVIEIVGEGAEMIAYPRPGKPEDYISKSAGVPYRFDFRDNTPVVKEVLKWIHQVFVDDDTFRYFMKDCAAHLRAGNIEKLFRIWTGNGNNAKSMIVKLLFAAWGQYYIKVPTSLFTEKKPKSNQAQPELIRAIGARCILAQEPSDEEILQKGVVKEQTGGDSQTYRGLYKENVDATATHRVVLMANGIPSIPNADKAIYIRLLVLPFLSVWDSDAPTSVSEQYANRHFLINDQFGDRIKDLAPAFFWLIVKWFAVYAKERLVPSEEIKKATKKYWDESDVYQNYFNDRISQPVRIDKDGNQVVDTSISISFSVLYSDFKVWYMDMFPGGFIPKSTIARTSFVVHLGELVNGHWYGFMLNNEAPVKETKKRK